MRFITLYPFIFVAITIIIISGLAIYLFIINRKAEIEPKIPSSKIDECLTTMNSGIHTDMVVDSLIDENVEYLGVVNNYEF